VNGSNGAVNARPTFVRYYVLAALCIITLINYIQRNSTAGMVEPITRALQTDDRAIGDATSCFFVAYALFQIPSGWFAHWWGTRRALTALAIGWSLAAMAIGLSFTVWGLIASRTVQGILQAGIFPCATLIMASWLPPSRRAFASALLNSCMLTGGAIVNNLNGWLLAPLGWRTLLFVYAVPGILWAIAFYFWFRDRPAEHSAVNEAERALIQAGRPAERPNVGRPSYPWMAILLSLPLWLVCTQQFFRAGANRFTDQWLPRYLATNPLKHIENEDERKARANHLTSMPQYAGVVGGLVGGLVSDFVLRRTGSRRAARNGVAVASLALTVLSYLPIFWLEDAVAQVVFFSLGSFISAFSAPCAYALSMDIGGKNLPVVFGAMNMIGNFGAAAMSGIVPRLNGWSGGSWQTTLIVFVGIHALALFCWLVLDPRKTIGEESTAS